jgi:hypothetical protein
VWAANLKKNPAAFFTPRPLNFQRRGLRVKNAEPDSREINDDKAKKR